MLKFKKIELLTKTYKIRRQIRTRMLWPQNLKKYDLCWEEGDFFFGWGGWLFAVGESWDEEEEGEMGEERVGRVVIY
jgi:hypothetical protein